jgi:hypothetical protein
MAHDLPDLGEEPLRIRGQVGSAHIARPEDDVPGTRDRIRDLLKRQPTDGSEHGGAHDCLPPRARRTEARIRL